MMKRTFIIILTTLVGIAAFSQSVEEQKKKIASIKKNSSYIYAEVTTTSQQQAIDLATDMLHNNVNEWAAKKKKFAGSNKIVTRNMNYAVDQITMPRANMFRAFMYVKKSDIIPAENVEVRQTPAEVVAKAPKPKAATVSPEKTLTIQSSEVPKDIRYHLTDEEYAKLRGLKGKNQAEYIMVIFNKEGNIEALLSEGENRTNLSTGKTDQLTNYKGRGAIGVKVSK